ncbi:MAG: hypothetical protein U9N46_02190 [Euryarchaeota archaeon]|nr:hypothetical protein [Euryarchaeota archaeon]
MNKFLPTSFENHRIHQNQERTRLPAIVVMRAEPDMARIGRALQNLPDFDSR